LKGEEPRIGDRSKPAPSEREFGHNGGPALEDEKPAAP
jgi:hypothetical protein